jgi:hypothetical protein
MVSRVSHTRSGKSASPLTITARTLFSITRGSTENTLGGLATGNAAREHVPVRTLRPRHLQRRVDGALHVGAVEVDRRLCLREAARKAEDVP